MTRRTGKGYGKVENVIGAEMGWFVIRVTYGRELKFKKLLEDLDFRVFVPMKYRKVEKDGKQMSEMVPAVSNLCFVYSERAVLDDILKTIGLRCPARYFWDKASNSPVVVRDKQMEDFIRVSNVMADQALYLKDMSDKIRAGQKVRVKSGPLAGVEGVVIRIKRSRRVVVEVRDLLAIATTYIAPDNLETVVP